MVKATLGRWLADTTPSQLRRSPLRILEPACGHGIFLIKAYQYLLDWHLAYYLTHDPDAWAIEQPNQPASLERNDRGTWQLTLAERQRLLLSSVHGVDIDANAVQVTQQALQAILLGDLSPVVDPIAFPDLTHNLQWGNTLIAPPASQLPHPSQPPLFNWLQEFPQVMMAGGFDIVLGNPPYLDSERMKAEVPSWRSYCQQHYQTASGNWDLFCVFIERALQLCKPGGLVCLIVPNKLLSARYAKATRRLIAETSELLELWDYATVPAFPAGVYPIVFLVRKHAIPASSPELVLVDYRQMQRQLNGQITCAIHHTIPVRHFCRNGQPWTLPANDRESGLMQRLQRGYPPLGEIAEVLGAATVAEAYALRAFIQDSPSPEHHEIGHTLPVINSGTIDRYRLCWGEKPMRYLGQLYRWPVVNPANLPTKRHEQATHPKLILAGLSKQLECAIDPTGTVVAAKSTTIVRASLDLYYLLALLNSRLLRFYYRQMFGGDRLQGNYLRVGPPQLRTLPIPTWESLNEDQRGIVQQLQTQAKLLWQWHQSQQPLDQIDKLDRQLDELVYDLYSLTSEERTIVESAPNY